MPMKKSETKLIQVTRRTGKGYRLGPREPTIAPPDAKWITSKQLGRRYGGKSSMWIWRKVKTDPDFPRPIYDGRLQLFSVEEVENYDRVLIGRRAVDEQRALPVSLRKQKEAKAKAKEAKEAKTRGQQPSA
jgi:hypothetical protein